MRVTCPNCGGNHPKWECKAPATKSTALGKDRVIVGPVSASKPYLRNVPEVVDAQPGKRHASEGPAGTQALPVDTIPKRGRPISANPKSPRVAYQRDYVARWRRGEVGNKHKEK